MIIVLKDRNHFNLAISGSETQLPLFNVIGEQFRTDELWNSISSSINVFWVDERLVSIDPKTTRTIKLLFLGSSCIYPGNCPQPIKEEFLLTGELEFTNKPYTIAKIAGIKMCESYNIQYGTNFISVMPTNLYGPNDNYNLETSHVLPALIRKMHLGKCLENHDWEALRKDLKKYPIEGVNDTASETEIIEKLAKYGIQYSKNTRHPAL